MPRHGNAYVRLLAAFGLALSCLAFPACDRALLVPLDGGPPSLGPGAQIPLPPGPGTETSSTTPRVFVLRDVLLRQAASGAWRTLGWNLDDRCSYAPGTFLRDAGPEPDGGRPDGGPFDGWDIECTPVNMGDLPAPDGEDCRDNNYGQYVALGLETLPTDPEAEVRARMIQGEFAFLVRLLDYNGTANDPQLTVEIVQTAFGVPEGGRRGDALRWDGTDTFYPAEEAFDEAGRAILLDRTAYVIDGLLVMRVPARSDFRFTGTDVALSIRVTEGTLTGRIDGEFLRDAVLSARWAIEDLINELDDLGVCEGSVLRGPVENAVRGSADLLADPLATPGTLVPCDAISAAIGFTGFPGRWGKPSRPSSVRPNRCAAPPAPDAGPPVDAAVPDGGGSDAGV